MPNEKILEEILKKLDGISKKADAQDARIKALEDALNIREETIVMAQKTAPLPPPPPPPPPAETEKESPIRKENLEEQIGGQWFAKIGIFVLLLGMSFFLKYAFDNNWIGETGRVLMGIIAGIALLGVGEKLIRKYFLYGQIISGGGLAMLYLSVYAAFGFYNLIPAFAAFAFMILVTGAGIALSLRYDAESLIGIAIFGGFATPLLCSTGKNNLTGLFSYILILDLAILAVSVFKNWKRLNIVGFIGTVIIFILWAAKYYTEAQLFPTMMFLTLFFIVYSISSIVYNLYRKEKSTGLEQILSLVAGFSYFGAAYLLLNPDYHIWMGFFAVILAVYYFLLAYLIKTVTPDDENLYNFLAFLTVGFITIAAPIQFKHNIITVSWLIEAALLIWLGLKLKTEEDGNKNAVLILGATVSVFALFRLFFIDAVRLLEKEMFLFNQRFLTFFIALSIFYIIGYLFKKALTAENDDAKKKTLLYLMGIGFIIANAITLFAGSQEIYSYYNRKASLMEKERIDISNTLRGHQGQYSYQPNSQIDYKKIQAVKHQGSIVLSLFWLFYAIALLIIGFVREYKTVRVGGMLLAALALLKLFFYDLWNLGTLYRIISSISLGIALLLISFAYQKYKDKIKDII